MACIIQWNLQSLRTKFTELKVLLNDLSPAVVCLQETLIGLQAFGPSGFTLVRSTPVRHDGHERGAAILVDKRVHYVPVTLRTPLQAVAVRVWLGKWYTVCSLYIPHVPLDPRDLSSLLSQLRSPFLLLGDMNARSPLWGDSTLNAFGRTFESLMLNHPISLLNDGSPTHYHCQSGTFSVIDLSICSSDVVTDFNYSVTDDLRGSDHFPVLVSLVAPPPPPSRPRRFVESRADWAKFCTLTDTEIDIALEPSVNEAVSTISDAIIRGASGSMPLSSGVVSRRPVPWWTAECRTVFRQRVRTGRALRRRHSAENLVCFQRLKALCRVTFNRARRASWMAYLSSINSRTSLHKIWKKVQKISGKFSPTPMPVLRDPDGSCVSEPHEVASVIADAFAGVSHSNNYSCAFKAFRARAESRVLSFDTNTLHSYNDPFSIGELRHALSLASKSSPGEDQITYAMLRHVHPNLLNSVLAVYNRVYLQDCFPEAWRTAIVIPLPKPGKPHTSALDFRPIALTSCLCKLLEKMVNIRLMSFLESNRLLDDIQFGFRPNRSTTDNLVSLEHDLFTAFERKLHTIAVFFDIKKAYDMVWRWKILDKLHQFGLRGHLPIFIDNFLRRRFIRVRVGTALSDPVEVPQGTPQGSVLSCTCFLIAMHSIAADLPPDVRASLYVDDFTVYFSGSSTRIVERRIQLALARLEEWCGESGLQFSSEKTVAMHICRVRGCPRTAHNLTLFGSRIRAVSEHKYLGLFVDEKLNWKKHIEYLRTSSLKTLSLFRHLTSKSWGADMQSLIRLYIMLLKPKLDYGCEVYSTCSKTSSLDPVQNEVIRIASGAFRSSPIPSLLAVSGLKPLSHFRFAKIINSYLRIAASPEHPLCGELLAANLVPDPPFAGVYQPLPGVSFLRRGRLLCEFFGIPVQNMLPDIVSLCPTWRPDPPIVCRDLFNCVKSRMLPDALRVEFLAHIASHSDSYIVYTDGSRTASGVAFAAMGTDGWNYSGRLLDYASIFSAELIAVRAAVLRCGEVQHASVTICSDSRSVILALSSFGSKNSLVLQIQRRISQLGKILTLCWVPSHTGVAGNEACDAAARSAILSPNYLQISLPRCDLKSLAKHRIKQSWLSIWHSLPDNKLRAIIPAPLQVLGHVSSREWAVKLTRLRIGHSHLTHGFLMEQGPPPYCDDCIVPLTVRHLLVECPSFVTERRQHFGATVTMHSMLFGCDVTSRGPLFAYIKDIGIYNAI